MPWSTCKSNIFPKLQKQFLQQIHYRKNPNYSNTRKISVIILKLEQMWLCQRIILESKNADGMANSLDPDKTIVGALWCGSTLFAQA